MTDTESRRLAILATLQRIDPNGCWLDNLSAAEGLDPCPLADAVAAFDRMTAELPQSDPYRSAALADIADIARRQGAIDADDTDSDYDPWG